MGSPGWAAPVRSPDTAAQLEELLTFVWDLERWLYRHPWYWWRT